MIEKINVIVGALAILTSFGIFEECSKHKV